LPRLRRFRVTGLAQGLYRPALSLHAKLACSLAVNLIPAFRLGVRFGGPLTIASASIRFSAGDAGAVGAVDPPDLAESVGGDVEAVAVVTSDAVEARDQLRGA
jgi:hypothetical protein